jgi:fumarate hydratase class II
MDLIFRSLGEEQSMQRSEFRIEKDSMGEVKIRASALWGAQTQRAIDNFPISGKRFPDVFIHFLGMIKMLAAQENRKLGMLGSGNARAIEKASREVMNGKWNDQFVVDIFQTGSGTSLNMNANEVIARRANQFIASGQKNTVPVHANDHVNMGQSSNDVIPTCTNLAACLGLTNSLLPALQSLENALAAKARQFSRVIKIGRTHLQDALPVTLGQEFAGYAAMIKKGRRRILNALPHLSRLPLGGTAVGTGFHAHPELAGRMIRAVNRLTAMNFSEAADHFEAQGGQDAVVEASSALRNLAVSLIKIANDIRWLASGPRCGIGEIRVPEVQPGSSIMPGKTNPVMAEALLQVAVQVLGNDAAISLAGFSGNFELNTMLPLLALNLLESIRLLANGVKVFTDKCVQGIEAVPERCQEMVEQSLALATALVPFIGYDRAAAIAKQALHEDKTIFQVSIEKKVMPEKMLRECLDPWRMIAGKSVK